MPKHVVIIGGGASGVLLAAHLLRPEASGLTVTIVEKRDDLGAGAAYATNHPDHLLNVRASNMSAFPEDPRHFVAWLADRAEAGSPVLGPGDFAPRALYRDYLAGLIAPHLASGRLRCQNAEAVSVSVHREGVGVALRTGGTVRGDTAVLATGNEGPSLPPAAWRFDGWSDPARSRIDSDAPVVVVGTGLTMVDRALALLHNGHRGPITAVSRRGLVPQSHRAVAPTTLDRAEVPLGAPVSRLTGWLRRHARGLEAAGGDWRAAVDALRPYTQEVWKHLSIPERARFLRHARPFWDCHRHRIAPGAAARLRTARDHGQLRMLAAHVTGFAERRDGGVDVHLRMRFTREPAVVPARAVFECRGRSDRVTASENPVLQALLASRLARPDPLGLGLAVDDDCAVFAADGKASQRLYAVGPVTAGMFWEIVAIPDIRVQAARLAARLRA